MADNKDSFEFRMPEDAVVLSKAQYEELVEAANHALHQKALGDILELIVKIEPEGEIARGVSDILTFHQIHVKLR